MKLPQAQNTMLHKGADLLLWEDFSDCTRFSDFYYWSLSTAFGPHKHIEPAIPDGAQKPHFCQFLIFKIFLGLNSS